MPTNSSLSVYFSFLFLLSACNSSPVNEEPMQISGTLEVHSKSEAQKGNAVTMNPRNLQVKEDKNDKCQFFINPHKAIFFADTNKELARIDIKLADKNLSMINMERGNPFKAIYAHDSDFASESVTLSYSGTLTEKKVKGQALIDINELGKKCFLQFDFEEEIKF